MVLLPLLMILKDKLDCEERNLQTQPPEALQKRMFLKISQNLQESTPSLQLYWKETLAPVFT